MAPSLTVTIVTNVDPRRLKGEALPAPPPTPRKTRRPREGASIE